MSKDLVNAPAARSWRDIPQPVKPRAMSRGGQWRLALATLRLTALVALCATLGWGIWIVATALQESSRAKPAAARAVPVKAPVPKSDGVLDGDAEWLARTLRLPRKAALMELDLPALRERVLADGQVLTASLARRFPDQLVVQITERTPIARVMTETAEGRQQLLVARDGVVFEGCGYDRALIDSLPWLAGVALSRKAGRYQPIPDMAIASELLGKARLEAEHLYRTWHIVSLQRLRTDREIEVRTRGLQSMTIVFNASGDFLLQLAKLDYMWDSLAARAVQQARIDLTLGRQVPVTILPVAPAPPTEDRGAAISRTTATVFPFSSPLQSKIQREL